MKFYLRLQINDLELEISSNDKPPKKTTQAKELVLYHLEQYPNDIHLTVRELAKKIGVGKTTVSDVIKGIKADKEAGQNPNG